MPHSASSSETAPALRGGAPAESVVSTESVVATDSLVVPKPPAAPPASPQDVAELAQRLVHVAVRLEHYAVRLEYVDDSRCVFTRCYALLTRELAKSITNEVWQDAAWVVELAEGFVQRYFDAIDAYDAGLPAKTAWKHLQDEIRNKRSSVLQDLVLGLIGHIVHDLPLALEDIWLRNRSAPSEIDDYHRVNDVLGNTIAKVRAEIERLYNPYWSWLDWLGPATLKLLTDEGLRLSRAVAWYNALRLLEGDDRATVRGGLEAMTSVFADQLFSPPGWAARMAIRTLNNLVSFGRRWPRAAVPDVAPPAVLAPNQIYYFQTGVGHWRGSFRFKITDWSKFWRADLSAKDRRAALFTAGIMAIARRARLESTLRGYPDQGAQAAGVATSQIRVSVLGIALYSLREQYSLGGDGRSVHVRGYERVGPLAIGGINTKEHAGEVGLDGMTAHYTVPVYGVPWEADYQVSSGGNRVESVMRSDWAQAWESIERVAQP